MEQSKKEFAVRCLERIKELRYSERCIKDLGVDLSELMDKSVHLLEEAVARCITEDEDRIKQVLADIAWWIYEDGKKIIVEGKDISVEKPHDFIEWMEKLYKE